MRSKRSDFDHFDTISEDDQSPQSQTSGSSAHIEQILENNVSQQITSFDHFVSKLTFSCLRQTDEIPSSAKKSWGRGRAKSQGLVQNNSSRVVLLSQSQQQLSTVANQCESPMKPTSQGPRMPDGTRGFTMGRGKRLPSGVGAPMLMTVGLGSVQL